jgi:hypothetical protein
MQEPMHIQALVWKVQKPSISQYTYSSSLDWLPESTDLTVDVIILHEELQTLYGRHRKRGEQKPLTFINNKAFIAQHNTKQVSNNTGRKTTHV